MPPRPQIPTNAELAALMAQQMAAMTNLTNLVANNPGAGGNGGGNQEDRRFKAFMAAKPIEFHGSEGVTGLFHWLEKVESTFDFCGTPDDLKIKFAATLFKKRALTWWNSQVRATTRATAHALPWADFTRIIKEEFCHASELQALEQDFWKHEMIGGDVETYNNRYRELSSLVPHMVDTPVKAIARYIRGLHPLVKGGVESSRPTTEEQAMSMAITLTAHLVESGTLAKKGAAPAAVAAKENPEGKGRSEAGSSSSASRKRKRKSSNSAQSYAATAPAVPA